MVSMAGPIVPLTPAQTTVQEADAAHDPYLLNVLIALDCLGDALIGGPGDQTLSTSAALAARKHELIGSVVSSLLDKLQPDHGAKAAAGDYERAQAEAAQLGQSGLLNQ